jgi:hypothetical protein
MTTQAIAQRRANLLSLEMPAQRKEAREDAARLGVYAAQITLYLGAPRRFHAQDYRQHIIAPLYRAGACGTGLHDAWVEKLNSAQGRKDPRVVAFLKAANNAGMLDTGNDDADYTPTNYFGADGKVKETL